MPVMMNLGYINYVVTAIAGAFLAIHGIGGFTRGALASFLQLTQSFNQPISQVSQQFNSIIMALAGAERIFRLMEEEEEADNGYVTLVNAMNEGGSLKECRERTGMWAWKHPHETGVTTYTKLTGEVIFDGVDFGYQYDKIYNWRIKGLSFCEIYAGYGN